MPAHLIIDRGHSGPRLFGTFATSNDAEATRDKLIAEDPTLGRNLYILVTSARPPLKSGSSRWNVG